MALLYALLIIIIIAGSIAFVYVTLFNKMQYIKTKIEQAEAIIDESLREKYDLILSAKDLILSTVKSEKDYFQDLENLKNKKISNFDFDRTLNEKERLLMQFKNDNKELEDLKELKEILKKIKAADEKLTAAKSFYNKYTTEENKYARSFPSNIIAKLHGISVSAFFDGKDMTDDIIDDFKL